MANTNTTPAAQPPPAQQQAATPPAAQPPPAGRIPGERAIEDGIRDMMRGFGKHPVLTVLGILATARIGKILGPAWTATKWVGGVAQFSMEELYGRLEAHFDTPAARAAMRREALRGIGIYAALLLASAFVGGYVYAPFGRVFAFAALVWGFYSLALPYALMTVYTLWATTTVDVVQKPLGWVAGFLADVAENQGAVTTGDDGKKIVDTEKFKKVIRTVSLHAVMVMCTLSGLLMVIPSHVTLGVIVILFVIGAMLVSVGAIKGWAIELGYKIILKSGMLAAAATLVAGLAFLLAPLFPQIAGHAASVPTVLGNKLLAIWSHGIFHSWSAVMTGEWVVRSDGWNFDGISGHPSGAVFQMLWPDRLSVAAFLLPFTATVGIGLKLLIGGILWSRPRSERAARELVRLADERDFMEAKVEIAKVQAVGQKKIDKIRGVRPVSASAFVAMASSSDPDAPVYGFQNREDKRLFFGLTAIQLAWMLFFAGFILVLCGAFGAFKWLLVIGAAATVLGIGMLIASYFSLPGWVLAVAVIPLAAAAGWGTHTYAGRVVKGLEDRMAKHEKEKKDARTASSDASNPKADEKPKDVPPPSKPATARATGGSGTTVASGGHGSRDRYLAIIADLDRAKKAHPLPGDTK